jgi:glycosyltransferase involved in cell wall biosynthesis
MNILVFTTLFPNKAEPIRGVFVKERVRHFQESANVRVVAPVGSYTKFKFRRKGKEVPPEEKIEGLVVYHPSFFYIPGLFKALDGIFLFLSSLLPLRRLRREFRYDFIDAHYGFPDGFAAVLLGRYFHVPVSITIRGNDVTLLPNFTMRRFFIKYALKHADLLITVSCGLKNAAFNLLREKKDIHVVMNSVDHVIFHPMNKLEARKKLSIQLEEKIILSVGALIRRKGFQYLIEAAARIIDDTKEVVKIYIVGGTGGERSYKDTLAAHVTDLGLKERVVFWGPAVHKDLVYLYNSADLFCLFSEREGCPNVLMEAIACGLPAVVSGGWADKEMIPDDDVGYIAQSTDAKELERLIRKGLERTWDREKIRAFSLENSWENVGGKTMELFRAVAD